MRTIYCLIYPTESGAIIIDEDGVQTQYRPSHIDSLQIYEIAKKYDITDIKIHGAIDYVKVIANEIIAFDEVNYSENKINVEIF